MCVCVCVGGGDYSGEEWGWGEDKEGKTITADFVNNARSQVRASCLFHAQLSKY